MKAPTERFSSLTTYRCTFVIVIFIEFLDTTGSGCGRSPRFGQWSPCGTRNNAADSELRLNDRWCDEEQSQVCLGITDQWETSSVSALFNWAVD